MWLDEILLHVSRGVRWDSDHVVILTDELQAIAQELVRGDYLDRTHIGLDYFDASINRVAAWVIGTRAMIKALLLALVEPTAKLRELENAGDFTGRLAMLEECKTLPFGAVWDYYCLTSEVPVGPAWLDEIEEVRARRAEPAVSRIRIRVTAPPSELQIQPSRCEILAKNIDTARRCDIVVFQADCRSGRLRFERGQI